MSFNLKGTFGVCSALLRIFSSSGGSSTILSPHFQRCLSHCNTASDAATLRAVWLSVIIIVHSAEMQTAPL